MVSLRLRQSRLDLARTRECCRDPSRGTHFLERTVYSLLGLLPIATAIVMLLVVRDWVENVLNRAHGSSGMPGTSRRASYSCLPSHCSAAVSRGSRVSGRSLTQKGRGAGFGSVVLRLYSRPQVGSR